MTRTSRRKNRDAHAFIMAAVIVRGGADRVRRHLASPPLGSRLAAASQRPDRLRDAASGLARVSRGIGWRLAQCAAGHNRNSGGEEVVRCMHIRGTCGLSTSLGTHSGGLRGRGDDGARRAEPRGELLRAGGRMRLRNGRVRGAVRPAGGVLSPRRSSAAMVRTRRPGLPRPPLLSSRCRGGPIRPHCHCFSHLWQARAALAQFGWPDAA